MHFFQHVIHQENLSIIAGPNDICTNSTSTEISHSMKSILVTVEYPYLFRVDRMCYYFHLVGIESNENSLVCFVLLEEL